jgi:hypothetical protein
MASSPLYSIVDFLDGAIDLDALGGRCCGPPVTFFMISSTKLPNLSWSPFSTEGLLPFFLNSWPLNENWFCDLLKLEPMIWASSLFFGSENDLHLVVVRI